MLKSEDRNPKSERIPKSEDRTATGFSARFSWISVSDFGLRDLRGRKLSRSRLALVELESRDQHHRHHKDCNARAGVQNSLKPGVDGRDDRYREDHRGG